MTDGGQGHGTSMIFLYVKILTDAVPLRRIYVSQTLFELA